ncbi:MAG: copper ion binding protein, partial [Methanobacteriota archaeon]
MKKTVIKVSGMHCASCAVNIEKALNRIDGVSKASVNFASEKAQIEYDASKAGEKEIGKAIKDAGYGVGEKTLKSIFKVSGMNCATCATNIEKALKRLPGVKDANVNFASEKATISYFPDQVVIEDMVNAVKDAGYTLRIKEESSGLDGETDLAVLEEAKRKAIIAWTFTVP